MDYKEYRRLGLPIGSGITEAACKRVFTQRFKESGMSWGIEGGSVIVTTNLPFEQWTEVLGSQRLTGAVLDRPTHHCHILEATGESYRLKDAKKRSSKKK